MNDDFSPDLGADLEANFRLDLSQIGADDDGVLPIDDAEEDVKLEVADDEEVDGEGY